MQHILLIDSQDITAKGVKHVLDENGYLVSHLPKLPQKDIADLLLTPKPNLIIIDAPENELIAWLAPNNIHLPVIAFTNVGEKNELLSLFKLGISNHISKHAPLAEIITGIKNVLSNKDFLCAHTRNLLVKETTDTKPIISSLSDREKEIILLIAEGKSDKDVAEDLFISYHTVRTHRKNISKKIGFSLKNATELISFVNELQQQ